MSFSIQTNRSHWKGWLEPSNYVEKKNVNKYKMKVAFMETPQTSFPFHPVFYSCVSTMESLIVMFLASSEMNWTCLCKHNQSPWELSFVSVCSNISNQHLYSLIFSELLDRGLDWCHSPLIILYDMVAHELHMCSALSDNIFFIGSTTCIFRIQFASSGCSYPNSTFQWHSTFEYFCYTFQKETWSCWSCSTVSDCVTCVKENNELCAQPFIFQAQFDAYKPPCFATNDMNHRFVKLWGTAHVIRLAKLMFKYNNNNNV